MPEQRSGLSWLGKRWSQQFGAALTGVGGWGCWGCLARGCRSDFQTPLRPHINHLRQGLHFLIWPATGRQRSEPPTSEDR